MIFPPKVRFYGIFNNWVEIFCTLHAQWSRTFHDHLNAINHSIQFTCEKEIEGTLPFLDVELKRMGEKVSTGVYRKPTHTNRYIHFSSHHHPRIKTGVVQCLKRGADMICDEHTANREARMLQSTFEANGYPRRVVRQILRQPPHPTTRGSDRGRTRKAKTTDLAIPQKHIGSNPTHLPITRCQDGVQVTRNPPPNTDQSEDSQT